MGLQPLIESCCRLGILSASTPLTYHSRSKVDMPKTTYLTSVLDSFDSSDIDTIRLPPRSISGKGVLVLFQNRTGSNLLVDYLSQSEEINAHHEIFNADAVGNNVKKHGLNNLLEYLKILADEKIFLSKVGFSQFHDLCTLGIMEAFSCPPKLIVVRRRNIARQAISFIIAEKTKKWASFQDAESVPVEYNYEQITNVAHSFNQELMRMYLLLSALNFDYREIYYEDLVDRCNGTILGACKHLGIREFTPSENSLKFKKQAGDINEEHYRRFAADHVSDLG